MINVSAASATPDIEHRSASGRALRNPPAPAQYPPGTAERATYTRWWAEVVAGRLADPAHAFDRLALMRGWPADERLAALDGVLDGFGELGE